MTEGHDRRGFFGHVIRGAARVAEEVGSALRGEPAEDDEPWPADEATQETVPAAPARRLASVDELRVLCSELGHEAWADAAAAVARPSVRLTGGGDGTSRLGGVPDLPAGFDWPVWQGEELAFLGQIRLDDVDVSPLPAGGALLVFFALASAPSGERPSDGGGCRVVLVGNEPTERPERAEHLPEVPALPTVELTLPAVPEALDLDWSEAEEWTRLRERLAAAQGVELEDAVAEYHALHRLLGYPDTIVEGMELEAQLVSHGLDLSTGEHYLDPRAEELEPGAAEWRLLLQLSSDADLGVAFGWYERLFIWIRDADLRARRFDNVRAFVR